MVGQDGTEDVFEKVNADLNEKSNQVEKKGGETL